MNSHRPHPVEPQGPRVVRRSSAVDGFRLTYERTGSGPAVLALHGWPGDRHDWRTTTDRLGADVDVIVPDLRGFGDSDAHPRDPADAYTPAAQAASVLGLIDELDLGPVVLAGYDLGSLVAEQVVRVAPELVRALVLSPPVAGLGRRLGTPESLRERWYISFHQTELADELLDGHRDAVHAYLAHFWSQWSGPGYDIEAQELDRLTDSYCRPGAFRASVAVYRSGRPAADTSPISAATTLLWPERDPLFPAAWAADVADLFPNAQCQMLPGVGHFVPREAPEAFAAAIAERLRSAPSNPDRPVATVSA